MRLEKLNRGHRLPQKLIMFIMRLTGNPPPDVVRTLFYRPEFFGKPYSQALQAVMRGPSEWNIWERELFAAFTSRLNECEF
jgi:hypothetical protein